MKKIYALFLGILFYSCSIFAQTYYPLASGNLTENWSNASLITTNDVWTDYPNFRGFLGQDITTTTGTNPSTLLTTSSVANDLDVIANQTNTTITNGGVSEFDGIANPTIALQGSGTADAPHLIIYLNTTSVNTIVVNYNLRDLDGSADNAVQAVALQYRIGNTGNFINLPAGFVADASSGPSLATLVTPVSVTLPAACEGQAQVELRIISANAASNDEWIGVDDISISSSGSNLPPCTEPTAQPTNLTLNSTATTVTGSFTPVAAPTSIENYLVVRALDPALTQLPVDGTTYSVGQVIGGGNGTVVALSLDGNFTNTVSPATQYYYFVFSMEDQNCSAAPNYLQANPLTNGILTAPLAGCVTPAEPISVVLTPANTSISGSFATNGANKYLVVISTAMSPTATPINGTVYTTGQTIGNTTVVKYNSSNSFTASGLMPATAYYIFVYAANDGCTGEPFYSTATPVNTTTTNTSGPPAGYYSSATGLSCDNLKTALFNIIKPTVANPAPTYSGICNIYTATDYRKSDDGLRDIIWDMYSDNPTGPDPYEFEYGIDVDGCGGSPNNPPIPGTAEGLMYNREHSFPQNWFGGSVEPMYSDIIHIFPTDKEVNNRRGSFPYGEVSSPTFTSLNGGKLGANTYPGYSGTVFEPINEYKGDFARAQFYMITAYQDKVPAWPNTIVLSGNSYPSFNTWYLRMLYKWHINDPVSAKEISRNNEVYNIQGNRNPFVDNPQYVTDVWNCSGLLPVDFTDVSAKPTQDFVAINWTVANEINVATYQIERSLNAIDFKKIGSRNANNNLSYTYNDYDLQNAEMVYYRIKSVDVNGSTKQSKIVAVKLHNKSGVLVYPNPTNNVLNVRLLNAFTNNSSFQVIDITGKVLLQTNVKVGQSTLELNVANLASGKYFLKIVSNNSVYTESFMVTK
jgi:hypothetical protein